MDRESTVRQQSPTAVENAAAAGEANGQDGSGDTDKPAVASFKSSSLWSRICRGGEMANRAALGDARGLEWTIDQSGTTVVMIHEVKHDHVFALPVS